MATDRNKKDETTEYTPLTDPSFRNASLSPMTIEERRRWEVMFARFHQPHSEITAQFEGFTLPPGGEPGDFLATDGKDNYYWSHGTCYWLRAGANIYFATGNIAVGDVPNDTNTIYAKGNILVQSDLAQPYVKISNASDTARDPVIQFAVGATPVVKITQGWDDSEDKWKLATGSEFGSDHDVMALTTGDAITPPVAEFTLIDTWQTPVTGDAETPAGSATDGDYLYYSVNASKALVKIDPVAGTELARVTVASATGLKQLGSDGTRVYVLVVFAGGVYRIQRYACSDLAYEDQSGALGGSPNSICYWGGHIYYADTANTVGKVRCSDLSVIWTVNYPYGDPNFLWPEGIATDGSFLYVIDDNANKVFRFNMGGTPVDATAVVNPMQNRSIWLSGQYVYVGVNTSRVDQLLKSDLSLVATFTVAASAIPQAFSFDNHHYIASTDDTCIYKYTATSTEAAGAAGLQIRLRDQYSQMVDVAKFTGDVRFGVGTTMPTETIEGIGNIKATGGQFISTKATGTPPIIVSSTTVCPNLNSGLVDGYHATTFLSPKYIVQEANADLSAEQSLGALATGIVKNTTTAGVGVLSIATGADFPEHNVLSATHGDSTAASVVRGDLMVGIGATPKWTRYAKGTAGYFLKATADNAVWAAHGLSYGDVGAEPALGNPGTTGWVLSSTDAGVRSWIAAGGALALDDLTDVDAAAPTDHDIIQFHTGLGWVHGALPAGANHDILSATHSDTTADAVVRGDIIIGSTATPKWTRLAKGTATHVLTMGADEPAWAAPTGGGGDFLVVQVFS